ncbi:Coenzyme F420 hydrogenase/dehydrogenase, beta subunit C-terminal domain [candidate division WOR-3 bacterium]|nr:Coenzyme F420 hydrogenase/dehydrogenase, beta subunit C-terminal domain [candidate division WOR-3 bacterium]
MKAFEINKPPDAALKDIILFLIEQKGFGGVFTLIKKKTGEYVYALITDKNTIDSIVPTFPFMPANAGKLVSRLTMIEATKRPLIVTLMPCELRALYELVKLEQARLDNLLFISFTCNGVLTLSAKNNDLDKKVSEYWNATKTGDAIPDIRETCTLCEAFIPENADIILALAGQDISQKTTVFLKTAKGETTLMDMNPQMLEKNLESAGIETIQRARTKHKQEVFTALKTEELGWDGLIKLFGRCINCHACSSVCPICYCKLCYIDSGEKDRTPLSWERELNQKGSFRVPTDTVMYHLVRLLHVSTMCVGCGMCSDVCPTNIPIASIFAKVSDHIQKVMNYEPGKNLDQKMPLAVVNPEDFATTDPGAEKK